MSDARLRMLERDAKLGDRAAFEKFLLERERAKLRLTGHALTETLQIAASLGIDRFTHWDGTVLLRVTHPTITYWLAEAPVTWRQWRAYAAETGGRVPEFNPRHEDEPVVLINWHEAQGYCRWAGLRLPSEAEWHYAASPDGRTYPWGNEPPDSTRLNAWDTGPRHATEVGNYPAGRGKFGHLDLAGNVWEWCQDEWSSTPDLEVRAPAADPPLVLPTASSAAVAGATACLAAARPTGSGARRRSATNTSASASPDETSPDPTQALPAASTAAVAGSTTHPPAARPSAAGSTRATTASSSASASPTEERASDPSVSPAAVAGSTTHPPAARPAASGSIRLPASTASAFASLGEERDSDPTLVLPPASTAAVAGALSAALRPTVSGGTRVSNGASSASGSSDERDPDPTQAFPAASTAAVAGTSSPGAAARPSAPGSRRRSATSASAFDSQDSERDPDPTQAFPTASTAAVAGSASCSTAARPSAAGTRRHSASTASAFGSPDEEMSPEAAGAPSRAPVLRSSAPSTTRRSAPSTSASDSPGDHERDPDPTLIPSTSPEEVAISPRYSTVVRASGLGSFMTPGIRTAPISASDSPGDRERDPDPTPALAAASFEGEPGATAPRSIARPSASVGPHQVYHQVSGVGSSASGSPDEERSPDPTMSPVEVAGSLSRPSADRPSAAWTRRRSASTASVFASLGEERSPDPTQSAPFTSHKVHVLAMTHRSVARMSATGGGRLEIVDPRDSGSRGKSGCDVCQKEGDERAAGKSSDTEV